MIHLFLAMSPEQRLATNDNAIRAIEELRDAFKKRKPASGGSQRRLLEGLCETDIEFIVVGDYRL